ncbi:MAG: nucleoid-associated protein [Clostridiales bacterium]|jgi:hypothetical protein|nr:nucleoid-associated protein [Eubacteriales bacterium]MDH7567651.1 nucleoid-associated protein [Clostridiales bacterium]
MDMRNVNGVSILKAVVHILNNKEEKIILADFELELNEKVKDLLKSHIKNSISDENTRIAKFENQINVVRDNCQCIIDNDDKFITSSQQIARYLYDAMKHPNISPANFVICVYKVEEQKYVALLKMDFSEIVQTQVKQVEGRTKIEILISGSGMPNDKQKLHKCVFFKRYDPENEYDIILLDKQAVRSKTDSLVANFFVNSFLHCRLAKTNRDNTKNFKKFTEVFINEYFKDDLEKTEDLRSLLINTLKTADNINVTTFADTAFGDQEELREKYKSYISEQLGDYTFEIDKQWVREKLRKKKIKTNTGIEISVEIETSNDASKFEIKHYDNKKEVDIIVKNVTYSEKIF